MRGKHENLGLKNIHTFGGNISWELLDIQKHFLSKNRIERFSKKLLSTEENVGNN